MERSTIIVPAKPSIPSVSAALRSEFPVLERVAYLNTGSVGPVPRRAAEAALVDLRAQLEEGRAGKAQFERLLGLGDELRAGPLGGRRHAP